MQPEQPQSIPPIEQPAAVPTPVSNRRRVVLALWLMIGPTALIICSILLYAIVNFAFGAADSNSTEPFGHQNALQSVINIFMFIVGAVAVVAWLPGLVTGIVLLATKKR